MAGMAVPAEVAAEQDMEEQVGIPGPEAPGEAAQMVIQVVEAPMNHPEALGDANKCLVFASSTNPEMKDILLAAEAVVGVVTALTVLQEETEVAEGRTTCMEKEDLAHLPHIAPLKMEHSHIIRLEGAAAMPEVPARAAEAEVVAAVMVAEEAVAEEPIVKNRRAARVSKASSSSETTGRHQHELRAH